MTRPLCFVLMPFGKKQDASGATVDFDAVYQKLIAPAIEDSGLEPLRADEEMTGGIIHKPMFERLILCPYAVADLTTANANVFYELGVRHAIRPYSTVPVFARGMRLPFDVAPIRALPYDVSRRGLPLKIEDTRKALAELLRDARQEKTDSPVFQLVEDLPAPQIGHAKTDVFRDKVTYSAGRKQQLAEARKKGADAVRHVERHLGAVVDVEAGVLIDLFLSYRAVKAWKDMIALADNMSPALQQTVMVQEQLALALNRDGQGDRAEQVLKSLIDRNGPSSETYGLLGRVYKDRWEAAAKANDSIAARGLLRKAIDAYLKGFETDWRDAYPGINAVTLMEIADPPDPRREKLKPIVRYAVDRKIANGEPDYWDHATLLEIAVLEKDRSAAEEALGDALGSVREKWEPETTIRNLRLIREARQKRNEPVQWAENIERELLKKT